MNKLKYLSWALVPAFALAMASCNDKNENENYVPTPLPENRAYFPNNGETTFDVSDDIKSIDIPVYRTSTEGVITVPITVLSLDDVETYPYQFEEGVTFADGEKISYLKVSFDPAQIEFDDEQEYELTIDENFTTPYGLRSEVITLVKPAPYDDLGVGTYTDAFFETADGDPYSVEVHFYQNQLDKTFFRIDNPYDDEAEDKYFTFRILTPGTVIQGTTVTMTNLVAYEPLKIMYLEQVGGDLSIVWPGNLQGYNQESDWQYNYVAAYQEDGLPGLIYLSPFYLNLETGRGYDLSEDEIISMVFPGYDPQDLSAEVVYEGILSTGTANSVLADVKLGSDVTSAKVGIGSGKDESTVINGINNGSIQTVTITSSGEVKIPFDATEAGNYTIAVITSAGGTQTGTASTTFYYAGSNASDPNEGWKSLGMVDYTDGFFCAMLTTGIQKWKVEIQESTEQSGVYRLVDPYGKNYPYISQFTYDPNYPAYLVVNASDPNKVWIPYTELGTGFGSYGDFMLWSVAGYTLQTGETVDGFPIEENYGTLADGKITFPAQSLLVAMTKLQNGAFYFANIVALNDDEELTNEDGTLVAPFLIDLNTITATAPASTVASHKNAGNVKLVNGKRDAIKQGSTSKSYKNRQPAQFTNQLVKFRKRK